MIPGVDPNRCRTPEILADAGYIILNRDARKHTGHLYIDEEVLAAEKVGQKFFSPAYIGLT